MPTRRALKDESKRLLLVLLSFAVVLLASTTWKGQSPVYKQNKATVVFALSASDNESEMSMDAVVVIRGGRFQTPFSDSSESDQERFAKTYFAEGKNYRLIFGGGEVGMITLTHWSRGCNSVHANVQVTTNVRLNETVRALATNSNAIGKKTSSRRSPTADERARVLALVKGIYLQNGTPANLIPSIKVTNLTATDLNDDGKYEIVGSFTMAAKNKFERDLFLITTANPNGFSAEFIKFQAYQPPSEGFLSSIDFLDQVDLDSDGVAEVFATHGGFDAYGYLIFKKVGGHWRQVYEGIGDAC